MKVKNEKLKIGKWRIINDNWKIKKTYMCKQSLTWYEWIFSFVQEARVEAWRNARPLGLLWV